MEVVLSPIHKLKYSAKAFVDTLKDRIDKVKEKDDEVKAYAKQDKVKRKKRQVLVDSDLGSFLEDE